MYLQTFGLQGLKQLHDNKPCKSLEQTFVSKFYLKKNIPNRSIAKGTEVVEIKEVTTQLNLPSTLMFY